MTSTLTLAVIGVMGLLLIGVQQLHAQTWSEWWQQKKTRMKYMHLQGAAIEALRLATEAGNAFVEGGVSVCRWIEKREYQEHLDFFQSLRLCNATEDDMDALAAAYAREIALVERLDHSIERYTGFALPLTSLRESRLIDIYSLCKAAGVLREGAYALWRSPEISMHEGRRMDVLHSMIRILGNYYEAIGKELNMLDEMMDNAVQQAANDAFIKNNIL